MSGLNFFIEDVLLQEELRRLRVSAADLARLTELGKLCGSQLSALIETAHREGNLPRLVRYDRWGRRVDRIEYCAEQISARRLAVRAGVLPPTRLATRLAMSYLLNQNGEGGITCPLAMTEGLILLLEGHGTPEQRRRWLGPLRDPEADLPLTAGQFVTERQGGSNVSENETRAESVSDGSWRLTGLKWFCSNPGDVWVTTAKPAGSSWVALFLVPRALPDGSLNACHIQRLKEITGTRGKATAEVEYRGAHAELIGRPSHGMALLLKNVLRTSRIHTAAASLGFMRRARLEAELYARSRRAVGRPIGELPGVAASLDFLRRSHRACLRAFFEGVRLLEAGDPAAEVLVPLLKIQISRAAVLAVREAQLIFGGHGILRDFSILPRLADDALIQEIWEGTHGILAGHVGRALSRPASREAFLALCGGKMPAGERAEAFGALRAQLELLPGLGESRREGLLLPLCDLAWGALTRVPRLAA